MPAPGTVRQTFLSGRSARLWVVSFLACLGIISATAGLIEALFKDPFKSHGGYYLGAALTVCVVVAAVRAWPRTSFSRHFPVPGTTVSVVVGDLFEQEGHLVIGMCDTFDTGALIAGHSVLGQLQAREYGGDVASLDDDLDKALRNFTPVRTEDRADRAEGKLDRYEIGTVAVIGERDRRYFCVAYSVADNHNHVRSSLDELWRSLSATWEAVRHNGERKVISMAVIGSGLARLGNLSHSDLIRLIIISFLANSREDVVTDHLRMVIHPSQAGNLDLRELESFLSAQ